MCWTQMAARRHHRFDWRTPNCPREQSTQPTATNDLPLNEHSCGATEDGRETRKKTWQRCRYPIFNWEFIVRTGCLRNRDLLGIQSSSIHKFICSAVLTWRIGGDLSRFDIFTNEYRSEDDMLLVLRARQWILFPLLGLGPVIYWEEIEIRK